MRFLDSGPAATRLVRTHRSSLSPSLVFHTGRTAARHLRSHWRVVRRPVIAALFMLLAIPASGRTQTVQSQARAARDSVNWLRPGDLVRLRIWREPDLSGDFTVDPAGRVVLPKLGPIIVTRQSTDSLRTALIAAYQVYLNHPAIDVTFLRRIQVLGAVRNPGLYPIDPTMTLGDAVALAGGPTTDGSSSKVVLIRSGVTVSRNLSHGMRVADSQILSGDEIYVPERS